MNLTKINRHIVHHPGRTSPTIMAGYPEASRGSGLGNNAGGAAFMDTCIYNSKRNKTDNTLTHYRVQPPIQC